ncbi:TPA: helix-turn-helix domain-containing protein [Providencia rettgeri]|nr:MULTISPECIES: helix-turn-helix domain-containing protein [Providencia]EMB5785776.1 helix-turn-helix domain-containing protein [Providencia rettgeri]MDK7744190.1 helix-turn-helix domain-containing protein [Providencia rettgeri]MDK7756913.1 helix-turn-helix domain-containing protein [Providencia rettgeri]HBC7429389.1 helix-turn-helix domain-containing protein [Providencia rettgeri]
MMENKIKQLRLARAWSQEQLALLSSLSTRTIQRVENGEVPSLETLSALASVFNVSVSELTSTPLPESIELDNRIEEAKKRVRNETKLLKNIITAIIVCVILYTANYIYAPESYWPIWVSAIWGGLLAIKVIKLFLLDKLFHQWEHNRLINMTKKH